MNNERRCLMQLIFSVTLLFVLSFNTVWASAEPVSVNRFSNVAIGKHDVVSYHQQGAKEKGKKKFLYTWKGADWYFAEQTHRDLFAANPERYAPAYNGFCSNALSLDRGLVKTNGKVWHIWGDKLHTFYAKAGKRRWLTNDYAEMVAAADKAWQKELKKFELTKPELKQK